MTSFLAFTEDEVDDEGNYEDEEEPDEVMFNICSFLKTLSRGKWLFCLATALFDSLLLV